MCSHFFFKWMIHLPLCMHSCRTLVHVHVCQSFDCAALSWLRAFNDSAPIKAAPIVKTATNEMRSKVSCSDSNNNNNTTVHTHRWKLQFTTHCALWQRLRMRLQQRSSWSRVGCAPKQTAKAIFNMQKAHAAIAPPVARGTSTVSRGVVHRRWEGREAKVKKSDDDCDAWDKQISWFTLCCCTARQGSRKGDITERKREREKIGERRQLQRGASRFTNVPLSKSSELIARVALISSCLSNCSFQLSRCSAQIGSSLAGTVRTLFTCHMWQCALCTVCSACFSLPNQKVRNIRQTAAENARNANQRRHCSALCADVEELNAFYWDLLGTHWHSKCTVCSVSSSLILSITCSVKI